MTNPLPPLPKAIKMLSDLQSGTMNVYDAELVNAVYARSAELLKAANERILELAEEAEQLSRLVQTLDAKCAEYEELQSHPAQALRQQPEVTCDGSDQRALIANAERYRWLREGYNSDTESLWDELRRHLLNNEHLDFAIDAAMAADTSTLVEGAE